ncbi:Spy/CpxP family protein refolding chaperone [Pontibacter aydingkolensis]|uniref:LTXXQ motif family protein n=1 Tax=Pontibacter aydingkolensis TaxID=1911536 RepID=A0ABS7CV06_9BACT|nr:hypothetical protein [Pontibacter aydingkolensis]MBW7467307.1 hypothetical protein [Pontibacter aydingkolensis]
MRNQKLTFGVLAMSVLLTFSACQKDNAIKPVVEEAALEFESEVYQLPDIDDLENPVVTGDTETTLFSTQTSNNTVSPERRLSYILKQLRLDENQRRAVRAYVEQHAVCIEEHRSKVQEMHQQLLRKANAAREDYIMAYKAGRITKPELDEKLKALQGKLREEIQKLEQKQFHIRIMRKCRAELFTNIASVLNPEQKHKFRRWVQSL